jgi:hypothetical protein
MASSQQASLALPPNTILRLDERNKRAEAVIQSWAKKHAQMDIAVGLLGIVPFMAIPALGAAIAAQAPLIYQPMARELEAVYTVQEEALGKDLTEVTHIVAAETVHTSVLDITAEFGTEFMMHMAHELVVEAGLGVLAGLCVPILGGAIGAALDYLIANMMTWRVGTMVSLYYQNNGNWLGSRDRTFELAKKETGGISTSIAEILESNKRKRNVRVDLGSLRSRFVEISQAQIGAVKPLIEMMRSAMNNEQIRQALKSKGVPLDIIESALALYGSVAGAQL